MKIIFWGGISEVTGSKTFIELPQGIIMIDCGLIQGPPDAQILNEQDLPVTINNIKAIIVTHAHLDHSGYLPRLVKKGFQGKIYCTPATFKLMRIILLDSSGLLKDSFYNDQDVQKTLSMVEQMDWNKSVNLLGASFHFQQAGHILGASSVIMNFERKTIVFSGDLGRNNDPLIPPPNLCPDADMIVVESTYGGKNRTGDYQHDLHHFLRTISTEKRIGIIASFAVARAQMLLTLIHEYNLFHPSEKVRLVMDSPMMKEACKIYKRYAFMTKKQVELFNAMNEVEVIEHQKEWESLKKKSGPLIILSSSGMLTGGRIKRHLENWQDDEKAILFLPGFQGEGTPGRAFLHGERRMEVEEGHFITWKGDVWSSDSFSSHADQGELTEWLSHASKNTSIFLVHGEMDSKTILKKKLLERGFQKVEIAKQGMAIQI
jgi:metallo-beta-lactamase family protein